MTSNCHAGQLPTSDGRHMWTLYMPPVVTAHGSHRSDTKLCSCASDCLTAAAASGDDSAAWKLRRSSNCGWSRRMPAASFSRAAIANNAFASACIQSIEYKKDESGCVQTPRLLVGGNVCVHCKPFTYHERNVLTNEVSLSRTAYVATRVSIEHATSQAERWLTRSIIGGNL